MPYSKFTIAKAVDNFQLDVEQILGFLVWMVRDG